MHRDLKISSSNCSLTTLSIYTNIPRRRSITYNLNAGRKTVTNDYGVFLGILDPDDVFSYEE